MTSKKSEKKKNVFASRVAEYVRSPRMMHRVRFEKVPEEDFDNY